MFQKLFVLMAVGMCFCPLNFGADSGMTSILEFSDADWASIPTCKVTEDDVMNLFVGPVEIGGREWTMSDFNNDKFREVIADRQFDVRVFDDEDTFVHQQFQVDSEGYIQYKVAIESLTKILEETADEDGETVQFSLCSLFSVRTKLTAEELDNPIVKYLKSNLSFEEMNALHLRNSQEFEATVGLEEAKKVLVFLKPELHAEVIAALEGCRKETADAAAASSKK